MLVGQKGVKYGLQKVQPKAKPGVKAPIAAFAAGDSDEDEPGTTVGRDVARQAVKKRSDTKVAELHQAALAEDPHVFDYDAVYDDLAVQRAAPRQAEKLARKSRYIEGLMDKAKEREREQNIIYERKLAKEREAEDHLFGDKDKFVTAAYKRKLQEDQLWLAEEKAREAREAAEDVTKRGHLGDFYRNLLNKNVAFGGQTKSQPDAKSAAAGAKEAAADTQAAGGSAAAPSTADAQPKDAGWQAARRAREAYDAASKAREQGQRAEAPQGAAESRPAPADKTAAEAPRARASERQPEAASTQRTPAPTAAAAVAAAAGPARQGDKGATDAAAGQPHASKPEAAGGAPEQAAGDAEAARKAAAQRRNDEARVAAARERFLARKRKAGEPAPGDAG